MLTISEEELKKLVNELSLTHFGKPYPDDVIFNGRLRTTGGRYIPSKRKIELNPKFPVELGEEEFHGIIKHELCHYHLHVEGRGYKHGDPEFKHLLKTTGSPRHCQTLPSVKSKIKHKYACQACGQLYNRMRKIDTRRYRCGKCKGKLGIVNES